MPKPVKHIEPRIEPPPPLTVSLYQRSYAWVLSYSARPWAPAALACFAIVEAIFFPIPPDVLLIPMVLAKPKSAYRIAATATVASVFGGLLGYFIGAALWDQLAPIFFEYVPGFSQGAFEKMRGFYSEYGTWIVFTAGFSPVPFKLFTLTSGALAQPFLAFFLAATVGRAARFFLVSILLARYGQRAKAFIEKRLGLIMFGLCLILGIFALLWGLR